MTIEIFGDGKGIVIPPGEQLEIIALPNGESSLCLTATGARLHRAQGASESDLKPGWYIIAGIVMRVTVSSIQDPKQS